LDRFSGSSPHDRKVPHDRIVLPLRAEPTERYGDEALFDLEQADAFDQSTNHQPGG
jgi:hypothetical protein